MTNLTGFRVAFLANDGVEESELTEPYKALIQAGADAMVIAPHPGKIQAFRHFEKGSLIPVDLTLSEANPGDFEALVLPGGTLNADMLRADEGVLCFVRAIELGSKPIAAICHAPWILISAGLVGGRQLTSYPTIQDDIRNAGGDWFDRELIEDSNWITSRSPSDLPIFCQSLIDKIAAERPRLQRAS